MRIAQVTLRFDAPGGVETCVRELSRRFRLAGDEVIVFASDLYDEGRWQRRGDWAPVVDGNVVRRFRIARYAVPGLSMPMMIGLIDSLAASDADVVHAHSHRYGHVLEAALVARRSERPYVVSTHYHPAATSEPALRRGLLRAQDVLFGASAYRVARALVVESRYEAELVGRFAPPGRIHVIPPGIDLASWRGPLGPPPDDLPRPYLLFIGRLASNKGLHFLVEALARIPPDARLPIVLMGTDWGERASIEERARALGVQDQLKFLGHVADLRRYRAVLGGAAGLVLPSEWEAFGLVLLEAMAAHVPIVATAVGGVPEVLDGGRVGALVPYGDVPRLAEALAAVGEADAATRERQRAAGEWVERFDWNASAERHRALYRTLEG